MNPSQKVFYWLLIGLTGVFLSLKTTDACSCMPAHPQQHYCGADYVILGRVLLRKGTKVNRYENIYKIDIKKTYKMSEKAKHYLKHGRITTSDNSAMCGVDFKLGELYVIAGRSSNVNLCDYTKKYSDLSIVERRGIAGGYKKGCSCRINPCFSKFGCGYNAAESSCDWKITSPCETKLGACVPSRGLLTNEGNPLKCHWRRSPSFNKCFLNP